VGCGAADVRGAADLESRAYRRTSLGVDADADTLIL